MKRRVKIIAVLFTLVCIITGLFSGCKSRDEFIPSQLGTPEGLWLYHYNTRSRTDGTEKETLLQTVEYEGKSYDQDSFEIEKLIYVTSLKTIVYVISVFDEAEEIAEESPAEGGTEESEESEETEKEKTRTQILYRYSYKEKKGEVLYTLPTTSDVSMQLSDSYLYVHASDFGILFNASLDLVGEDFENCTFKGNNFLYRYTKLNEDDNSEMRLLEWYYDGAWKSTQLSLGDSIYHLFRVNDYIYIFTNRSDNNYYYNMCVNVKTGEQTRYGKWEEIHVFNDEFFILDGPDTGNPTRPYTLNLVNGTELTPVYTFKPKSYQRMSSYYSDDDYVYLELVNYNSSSTYYKMDRRTHKIQIWPKVEPEFRHYFEITVGGYTFYQNELEYHQFLSTEYFVYLYRRKGGVIEIMQYVSSEDVRATSRCIYNDICEF